MPFVRIELLTGETPEFKRALLDQVHLALVDALRIPDDDRTQQLYGLPPEAFELPAARRPDPVLIEITCFSGRSLEAKHNLYRRITERLGENPGVEARNACIVLKEANWGSGGQGADQIDLGFKVNA